MLIYIRKHLLSQGSQLKFNNDKLLFNMLTCLQFDILQTYCIFLNYSILSKKRQNKNWRQHQYINMIQMFSSLNLQYYIQMEVQQQSITQLPLRIRGPYSKMFKTMPITSNHYALKLNSLQKICIYKIVFTPKIIADNNKLRNQVLAYAMSTICQQIPNPVISGFNIYTTDVPKSEKFEIQVAHENVTYLIEVKKVNELNVKENPKVLLHFLNNRLRNLMQNLDYVQIGKTSHFFNTKRSQKIDDKLSMFSGFKSNFVFLERGIFLRVDTVKKIVRQSSVLQAINNIYNKYKQYEKQQKRDKVKNELIGRIIMTNYGKTRYYKIEDIIFEDLEQLEVQNGVKILDYYLDKYKITPKTKKQPVIIAENKNFKNFTLNRPTYLIPELCLMTGIPQDMDEFRRKKISESTIKSANEKKNDIHRLIKQIKNSPENQTWNDLGFKISDKMETIEAKIIPPPKIMLGEGGFIQEGRQANFNLFSKPIYASKHGIKLGLVYYSGLDSKFLISTFENTAKNLKVDIDVRKYKGGDFNPRRGLQSLQELIKQAYTDNCNVCLVILPYQLRNDYKKIKNKCVVDCKMICQIILQNTMRKKNLQSVFTKVLLQIIAKRGNTLWVPKPSSKMEKIMLVAFENSKMKNGKMVMSACSTINSTFTSICSKVGSYRMPEDRYSLMKKLLLACVDAYVQRNKQPPHDIIIFHNSFSQDQHSLLRQYFIEPILESLDQTFHGHRPCLTFVTINTKTNERFFAGKQDDFRNVKAGTLVSNDLVSSDNYDFFMVSQFTNRGSSLPNHYQVIYHDSKMQQGVLQQLIFGQCFNYVNWTGSIKVPGILQYSKKCAKFCSQVLQSDTIPDELQNKLYFI